MNRLILQQSTPSSFLCDFCGWNSFTAAIRVLCLSVAAFVLLGSFIPCRAQEAQQPHPDAKPNMHAPGEVDRPELVPFIVERPEMLGGLVLDETDAELEGDWQYSTHTPPYVGLGYLHDHKRNKGKSKITYRFEVPITGEYEVRVSHCYNARRATNTPVSIDHAKGTTTVRINQQERPATDALFRSIGVFRFEAGKNHEIRISNKGTEGKYVIADAIQLLPSSKWRTPSQPVQSKPADESRIGHFGGRVYTEHQKLIPFRVKIPGSQIAFQMVPIPGRPATLPVEGAIGKGGTGKVELAIAPFWMATCEVTWAEYHEFDKLNSVFRDLEDRKIRVVNKDTVLDAVSAPTLVYEPSYHYAYAKGPDYPATTMTRFAARQYTKWLSLCTGIEFRLPTESEWEHACASGSTGKWHFGNNTAIASRYCHFDQKSVKDDPHSLGGDYFATQTLAVKTLEPNAWGLFDMHGNVAEWVVDASRVRNHMRLEPTELFHNYTTEWRKSMEGMVHKGGSASDSLEVCETKYRSEVDEDYWTNDPMLPVSSWWFSSEEGLMVGFRVVVSAKTLSRDRMEAFWGPDEPFLVEALQEARNMGRNNLGIADEELSGIVEESGDAKEYTPPWDPKYR